MNALTNDREIIKENKIITNFSNLYMLGVFLLSFARLLFIKGAPFVVTLDQD